MGTIKKELMFNNDKIFSVLVNGKIYVGISNICLNLGMNKNDKDRQIKNVQSDFILIKGCVKFDAGVFDPNNSTIAIELEYLPIWLAKVKITPDMVENKKNLVEKLLDYQLHCKDVLAEAFLGKRTLIQLPTAADQSEGLYLQEKDISFRVNRIEKNKKVIADAQIQIIYDCEFIINSSGIIKGRIEEDYIKNLNKDYLENGVFPTVLEIDVLNADRLEIIKKKLNSK